MKKFMFLILLLAGCQWDSLLMGLKNENEKSAQKTESVSSDRGLNTYGSASLNTSGEGNSGEIESPGGGEGVGASGDGGMDVEEP